MESLELYLAKSSLLERKEKLELSPEGEIIFCGFDKGDSLFEEFGEYPNNWFEQEVIGKDGNFQKLEIKKTKNDKMMFVSVNGKKLLKAKKEHTDKYYCITEIWLHKTEIIPDEVFMDSFVEKIHFPDGLKTIGDFAFYNSCLQKVDFPSGVKISSSAFDRCLDLQKATLAEGIEGLPDFYDCLSLSKLELPTTVEKINSMFLFNTPKLTELALPDGLDDYSLSNLMTFKGNLKTIYCNQATAERLQKLGYTGRCLMKKNAQTEKPVPTQSLGVNNTKHAERGANGNSF